jgi:GDP-L-fucose synthase
MNKDSKIYIAGHTGLIGSALLRKLQRLGYSNLIYRTHKELDLMDFIGVSNFFNEEIPEYVFLCAAKVGGIHSNNTYPANFLLENIKIQNNIIEQSLHKKVKKLVFLGSSCIYPKYAKQPIKEEELLNGKLESTNEAYAIAKISGILLCKSMNKQYGTNFVSAMPNNAYGYNDNFNLKNCHVIPALLRKFHEAKILNEKNVILWGTGFPLREFIYADDLATGLITIMKKFDYNEKNCIINIGSGAEVSIKTLAKMISSIVDFTGKIVWDNTYPDGTPRKLLDNSKILSLGWEPKTSLEDGLSKTYSWFAKKFKKRKEI